jgi:VWFA-related protein
MSVRLTSRSKMSEIGGLMTRIKVMCWLFALVLFSGEMPRAQFRTAANSVMVDVTVRDGKGKPIVGLGLDDFELQDDSIKQTLTAFAAVAPDTASANEASVTPPTIGSPQVELRPSQAIVAVLFERLSPESRIPARDAALALFGPDAPAGEWAGVFVIDLWLRTVQTFTTDRQLLRKAVTAASQLATSYYEPDRVGIAKETVPATLGAESSGAMWIWPTTGSANPAAIPDMSGLAGDKFRELTQLQQGYASLTALEAVVHALSTAPGRKTLLYFSDGLPIARNAVETRFTQLIDWANRSNVSIYPIDAVGLRLHSQDVANAEALQRAAASDMAAAGSKEGGGSSQGLQMAESISRSGTTSQIFHRLADNTGGLVVENTNDLNNRVQQINLDRQYYYLLGYVPSRSSSDGRFHAIKVSLTKRKGQLRFRQGYWAQKASR